MGQFFIIFISANSVTNNWKRFSRNKDYSLCTKNYNYTYNSLHRKKIKIYNSAITPQSCFYSLILMSVNILFDFANYYYHSHDGCTSNALNYPLYCQTKSLFQQSVRVSLYESSMNIKCMDLVSIILIH